jgi:hypothetical protein
MERSVNRLNLSNSDVIKQGQKHPIPLNFKVFFLPLHLRGDLTLSELRMIAKAMITNQNGNLFPLFDLDSPVNFIRLLVGDLVCAL